MRLARIAICAAVALTPVSTLAQEQIGPWSGGPVDKDPFDGCAYGIEVADGVSMLVYWAPGYEPSLQITNTAWRIYGGFRTEIEVGFDNYAYPMEAEQARNRHTYAILFDPENGDSITDVVGWTNILTLTVDDVQYTAELLETQAMLDALSACVNGNTQTMAGTGTAGIDGLFSEFGRTPIASFYCLITGSEMVGMPSMGGNNPTTAYNLDVFDDASLHVNGVTVPALHSQFANDPSRFQAAYDVRSTLRAQSSQTQLPSTFTAQENAAFTGALAGMTDMMFAGRQRVLIVSLVNDVVAMADITDGDQYANSVRPQCSRTR